MAASSSLDAFAPQHLANTLWALAQLQHQPPRPWMQQLLLASLQQMQHFTPVDYTQMLSGLSQLSFTPSPLWLSSFWSRSGQCLTSGCAFEAQQLHALSLAAVKLELHPPAKWVEAASAAVERGLAGFGSQQLLEVLQALQQLWQASAAVPASAAGAVGVGSKSSRSEQGVSSSMVPVRAAFERSGSRVLLLSNSDRSSSGSNSSAKQPLRARYGAPGVLRLYRQLSPATSTSSSSSSWRPADSAMGNGDGPVQFPHSSPHSSSTTTQGYDRRQQQHVVQYMLQPEAVGLQLGPLRVDEAYSMACLVLLMPPHLASRVEHWPQLLAASRAQQQQQVQEEGAVLQIAA